MIPLSGWTISGGATLRLVPCSAWKKWNATPFIIGELACGSLHRRSEVLSLLERLPRVPVGSHNEVLTFVERHRLMGRGIGWIEAHLLASAALAGTLLWSHDRGLSEVARTLDLYAQP